MGPGVERQVPALTGRATLQALRPWLPTGLALALLVVLDLARAAAGPAVRPWQWVAGAAVLLALAARLHAQGGVRRGWPVLALAACLLPLWVDHARVLESDGIHYYTYLRSALFDLDLDLRNDYVALGSGYRSVNVLPVGAPIVWAPLVVLVHAVRSAAGLLGLGAPAGTEPVYQAAACLATVAYGTAGLFLLQHLLRQLVGNAVAFWTTLLLWVGTPLRFYLAVLPSLAHGAEFFAAVLVLWTWLALRRRMDVRRAAWCGAACGLVFLLRSQDGLLLAIPGLEIAWSFVRGRDRRGAVRAMAALVATFALVALPQVAVWQAMFGTPFLIPHKALHGEQFLHQQEPQLLGGLVSERGGVFVTYPVLLAAVLGLFVVARRDPRYVLFVAPVLVGMWVVNASVFDWYQVRRFTGVVPLVALGLAAVVRPVARAGPVLLAILTLLAWRYDLAVDGLRTQPGEPAPVRAVVSRLADDVAGGLFLALEPHAPGLAVRLLGSYTGEALLQETTVAYVELGAEPALLRVPRGAHNLSPVTVEAGRLGRWVTDREARLFVPVDVDGALRLTVHAWLLETVEPQAMSVRWNGWPVGTVAARPGWAEYRYDVPREALRRGLNEVAVSFERAPQLRRVRGEGPRGIRPAVLHALELHTR